MADLVTPCHRTRLVSDDAGFRCAFPKCHNRWDVGGLASPENRDYPLAWCTNHPERKSRARGLCASCYEVAHRKGEHLAYDLVEPDYTDALIEDLEFVHMTWDTIEETYKRPRRNVQEALRNKGRHDLIRQVHYDTYGAMTQADIQSNLRIGKEVGK